MTTPRDRFDPGPGWRRATAGEAKPNGSLRYSDGDPTHEPEWWAREAPVPPLPTEDGTTIRVQWRGPASENEDYQRSVVLVVIAGTWYEPHFGRHHDRLADEITGFEVLAEPRHGAVKRAEESARRLTAKAVLDRVRFLHLNTLEDWTEIIDTVAREFRVSS